MRRCPDGLAMPDGRAAVAPCVIHACQGRKGSLFEVGLYVDAAISFLPSLHIGEDLYLL